MGKKERDALKRRIKGIPGNFVVNQKSQVFEDRRTKRSRTRTAQEQKAIDEQTEK